MNQQSGNFGLQRQREFGSYLKDLRERRSLSCKQIADEFHVNLWDIEKGGRPASVDLLIKLSKKYDVLLEELLRRKFSHQLPLLDGIMRPSDLIGDLRQELHPDDIEEVTRYIAFLLLKRAVTNGS